MLRFLRNFFAPAPSADVIREREELYVRYFGQTPQIYHATDKVFPHIDVYHFEPAEERPFHTLLTGGMAEYRQPEDDPSAPRRLELMIRVKSFQWWAANLLKMVAEFPAQNDTFFGAYHTIPFGARLDKNSEISAFLLGPPRGEDLSRLAFTVDSEAVEYLACIPITVTEHAYDREVDSEELYRRLEESNRLIHTDDQRGSVIDYTPGKEG